MMHLRIHGAMRLGLLVEVATCFCGSPLGPSILDVTHSSCIRILTLMGKPS